jgi:hypothetical protein
MAAPSVPELPIRPGRRAAAARDWRPPSSTRPGTPREQRPPSVLVRR